MTERIPPKDARTGGERYVEGGFEPRSAKPQEEEKRSWLDKARDEVGAILGDQDAEARRKRDHEMDERKAAGGGDWEGHDDDTGWRDPVSPGEAAAQPTDEAPREHRPGQFRDR